MSLRRGKVEGHRGTQRLEGGVTDYSLTPDVTGELVRGEIGPHWLRKAVWSTTANPHRHWRFQDFLHAKQAVPMVQGAQALGTSWRAGWVVAGRAVFHNAHGPSSCLCSQPRRHPDHEVLRPDLPQQHSVLGRPCPLCLLLPGQPVQPQCSHRPDGQPRGPVGQRLSQPAVGIAPGCLVRVWPLWPVPVAGVCLQPEQLPTPPPGPSCHSLFPASSRIHPVPSSPLPERERKNHCPQSSYTKRAPLSLPRGTA
jgi:hypothetical protein